MITTEYAGNYIYENGALQFFNTAEGYVEPKGTGWEYVFQYKDHPSASLRAGLGNIRLSYADADGNGIIAQTEIREENNYYPFGLKHKGYNNVVGGSRDHKYGFANKEEQDELGLGWIDITARNYDPALGRWMNLDPLADNYYDFSTYVYTTNSPILFVDPYGKRVEWLEGISLEDAQIIGALIHQLRKQSKSFDKAFTRLHESEAVYKIGVGSNAGSHGLFYANREPNNETDEDGNIIQKDDFGNEVTNGGKGGEITFNLGAIKEDGLQLEDILPEEFAHAFTHDFYTDGGKFENYNRRPELNNIEFEGQVISGIIKKEAGIRIHPNQPTNFAEKYGRNFDINKFSETIENWYNLDGNYYRPKGFINTQQLPTSVLNIISNNDE